MSSNKQQTDFGFKKVDYHEKEKLVKEVFDSVANKYDLMNDVLSLRMHHLWKARLIELMPKLDAKIIDVAGGTADIAIKFMHKAREQSFQPEIYTVDINYDMLKVGIDKVIDNNILKGISFVQANAEHLPFPENYFDYYIVAFGIRNMTDKEKVLQEAKRVLKSGGKFLCLEFSKVIFPILAPFYKFYSFNIMPRLGQLIADDEAAYRYLAESITRFPPQTEFKRIIENCGFQNVSFENLSLGIAAIHTAYKI